MKTLFITALLAIIITSCNHKAKETDGIETKSTSNELYACSMHPEITGKKGEECPKCGMALVKEKVKAIICLGVDNKKIIDAFGNVVDVMIEVSSMNDAVKMSQRLAEKGDTVLLSPACASFDLFENYEDRGRQFKQAVKNL